MKNFSLLLLRFRFRVNLAWLAGGALIFAVTARADVRVACVGDSITAGSGVRDRTLSSYPAQLARWLGGEYDVRNFGVGGTTMLSQGDRPYVKQRAYTDALAFRPDVVVIGLGTNDSKHPRSAEEKVMNNWQFKERYVADYVAMVAAFRTVNPAAKIYVCLPPPAFPGRWGIDGETIRKEVVPMVREVARETQATMIDLNGALAGSADLFPDTVHPNEDGARRIAAAVYQVLTGEKPPADTTVNPLVSLFANRRVLWLGDSITQNGRYVSFVEYYLAKKFPAWAFDIVSIGLSSETVSGLSEKTHPFPRPCVFDRLQSALGAVAPATVVACYGMNDGIYHPKSDERTWMFQEGIRRLSNAAHGAGAEFVLLTPPPFDAQSVSEKTRADSSGDFGYSAPFAGYDGVLAEFASWERMLSVEEAKLVVDLHSALTTALTARRKTSADFAFAKDGIHPSALGHLLMAHTFLRAIGIEPGVTMENLEAELVRVEADPLFKLVDERREKRSAGWLSFVGYNRGKAVKSDSVTEAENDADALQKRIDTMRRH